MDICVDEFFESNQSTCLANVVPLQIFQRATRRVSPIQDQIYHLDWSIQTVEVLRATPGGSIHTSKVQGWDEPLGRWG